LHEPENDKLQQAGIVVNSRQALLQVLFEGDAVPDADAVPGRISFWTSDATALAESFRVDDSHLGSDR